ncbi:MAG: hypothetical protein NTW86_21550 [Candidatus Sumerlaeota bacterium]|nr:hypothetical protein [Candidatus Sumerlaeota bacterium]
MPKVHVSRRDLKRDELRDFGTSLLEFYERRRVTIWTVLGVVAALWVTVKVWGYYLENKSRESQGHLSESLNLLEMALMSDKPDQRAQLLRQAANNCEILRNRYPGSQAAREALLLKGSVLFYMNSPEAALRDFTEYRETADSAEERARASVSLGYCYENQFFDSGMQDINAGKQALYSYKQAAEATTDPYWKHRGELGEARIMEVLGDLKEAVKIYEQIIADADAEKQQDVQRFGDDKQEKKHSTFDLLPQVSELFDARSIAQVQIDRLNALIQGGEIEAAKQLSTPPASAPASGPASGPTSGPASQPALQPSSAQMAAAAAAPAPEAAANPVAEIPVAPPAPASSPAAAPAP